MALKPPNRESEFGRQLKKFFLSVFVVATFVAYFLHEHTTNAAAASPANNPVGPNAVDTPTDPNASSQTSSNTVANPAPVNATLPPAVSTATSVPQASGYKNGTFVGPVTNAYYGDVQVQVVIQKGKIVNVQFLNYPHDRRTSQMINTQVMPWLTQEAIQAQSANVDIISGATLTSEAFAISLQAALSSASN